MANRKMTRNIHVRLTAEQHAKIRRATQVERERLKMPLDEGTLFRKLAMDGIEQILAAEPAKEVA